MICISYVGIEAFDVILYLSRTLSKLNLRVLIIDQSDTEALYLSMNHAMGLDSDKEIIHYRGVYYTKKIPNQEEMSAFQEGVVIMSFGLEYKGDMPFLCDEFNVVINTFPHIVGRMNEMISVNGIRAKKIRILIRDITSIDDLERVKGEFTFPYDKQREDYLDYSVADRESALACQVNQVIQFTRVSGRMKKHILSHTQELFPGIPYGNIKNAYHNARKGR